MARSLRCLIRVSKYVFGSLVNVLRWSTFVQVLNSLTFLGLHPSRAAWCVVSKTCRWLTGRLALPTLQLYVFKGNASRRAARASWTQTGSSTSVVCAVGTTKAARRSRECLPNLCKYNEFALLAGFQSPSFSVHFWVSHQKKGMETQTLKVIELTKTFLCLLEAVF